MTYITLQVFDINAVMTDPRFSEVCLTIDELIQTSLCNVLMYVCTMQPLVGHDAIFSALTGLTRLFDYRTYEVS